jgi:hypothetical protein
VTFFAGQSLLLTSTKTITYNNARRFPTQDQIAHKLVEINSVEQTTGIKSLPFWYIYCAFSPFPHSQEQFTLYGPPFVPDNLKRNILHFLIISFWCFQDIRLGSSDLDLRYNNYLFQCKGVKLQLRSHGYWHWCVHSPVGWSLPIHHSSPQSKSLFCFLHMHDNFLIYLHLYVHYNIVKYAK